MKILKKLKGWQGKIDVDSSLYYTNGQCITDDDNELYGKHTIILHPVVEKKNTTNISKKQNKDTSNKIRKITVKPYMTKPATPDFDFMAKWNNNTPMPMLTMEGNIMKETRGMVYMHLKGVAEETCNCSICGKVLKNEVSRYYGIGPICLEKLGIQVDIDNVPEIEKAVREIEWEGWVIKSAIIKEEIA